MCLGASSTSVTVSISFFKVGQHQVRSQSVAKGNYHREFSSASSYRLTHATFSLSSD
jgi:hypothetical protein